MQTSNQYKGIINCVQQMVRTEGVMTLYRGMVPPIAGVGALNAILFGTYNAAKRYFHTVRPTIAWGFSLLVFRNR